MTGTTYRIMIGKLAPCCATNNHWKNRKKDQKLLKKKPISAPLKY